MCLMCAALPTFSALGQHCKPPCEDVKTELERGESLEMAVRVPDRDMVFIAEYKE